MLKCRKTAEISTTFGVFGHISSIRKQKQVHKKTCSTSKVRKSSPRCIPTLFFTQMKKKKKLCLKDTVH